MEISNEIKGRDAILLCGQALFGERGFSLNDPEMQEIYRKVYASMVGGKTAEICGVEPLQGIFMIGEIGVGKTYLWRVMQQVFKNSSSRFMFVKEKTILDAAKDVSGGYGPDWVKWKYVSTWPHDLYIDELGMNSADYSSYGNISNPMADLIMERYELFVNMGVKTHFSTNLLLNHIEGEKSIQQVLGPRVVDRIWEMCQFIVWDGESKRKGGVK